MEGWTGPHADVVVTSPPYNLAKDYGGYYDKREWSDYLDWTEAWGGGVRNILRRNGSFFLNIGYTMRRPSLPFDVVDRMCHGRPQFRLQNVIHWIKSISIPERGFMAGHFKPINSDRFVNQCHEFIFHLTLTCAVKVDKLSIGTPYADKSNTARWKHGRNVRDRGNVWFIPYEQKNAGDMVHPCEFPPALPEMCAKLHGTRSNMIVYDPFAGIGSTAVACKKIGARSINTEINAQYVSIARKRWRATCCA